MTDDEIEAAMKEQLPPWAIGHAKGQLVLGAQLPTKDGRRMGNAHIVGIGEAKWKPKMFLYTVLTDAGTMLRMTANEIAEAFHPPQYVSNVDEVVRRFSVRE